MFSNESIILKPGLYGIMLSYSIQVYQAMHEGWLLCFASLTIPLTIMKKGLSWLSSGSWLHRSKEIHM